MNKAQIYGIPIAIMDVNGQILTNSASPGGRYGVTSPTAKKTLSTENQLMLAISEILINLNEFKQENLKDEYSACSEPNNL